MPKISIIVPVYNVQSKYFEMCIDSILNQTFQDIELIIVNDGAGDRITKICNKYENKDDRVHVIYQKNAGVSKARNVGVENSIGEWIMFVDADDWLEKQACESFENALEDKCDIIISRYYKDNEEVQTILKTDKVLANKEEKQKLQKAIFLDTNTIIYAADTPWAKLFNRDFINKNNIKFNVNLKMGEDGIFNFQVYQFANKIKFINKATYHYRKNEQSVCNSFNTYIVLTYRKIFEIYDELLKKYNLYNVFKEDFNYFIIRSLNNIIKKYYTNKANPKQEKELKQELKNELKENEYYKKAIKEFRSIKLPIKRKIIVILLKLNMINFAFKVYKFK